MPKSRPPVVRLYTTSLVGTWAPEMGPIKHPVCIRRKVENHKKACVKYLRKFSKAVVGVPPLLGPILTGHDLAEVADGHEDTFFVVLHRTHEDISQVLHQLNLG